MGEVGVGVLDAASKVQLSQFMAAARPSAVCDFYCLQIMLAAVFTR